VVISLSFVNTVSWKGDGSIRDDRLGSYPDFLDWAVEAGLIGDEGRDALRGEAAADPELRRRALGRTWSLREAMHAVFRAAARRERPSASAAARLNSALLVSSPALAIDAEADGFALRLVTQESHDVLVPVIRSADAFLRSAEVARLRECEGVACGRLYLDTTKNGSRRWCDMATCGNRAKAARHRRRLTRGRRSGA
jgi:predicted RNA-binding Zn ribbon-like protein